MPPPRRSSTRSTSATPVQPSGAVKRSTRGSSLAAFDSPAKRQTRAASQKPSLVNGVVGGSPTFQEVQTQQSYAYGSNKAPDLPDQLRARDRMTASQLAETIDLGIRKAQQRIDDHAAEAAANITSHAQANARADRARQRSTSRESSESPREPSVDTVNTEVRKVQRTGAWATSQENSSPLKDIPEEEMLEGSPEVDDDATRPDTDPSSFPSGIFDASYNYERGARPPRTRRVPKRRIREFLRNMWEAFADYIHEIYTVWTTVFTRIGDGITTVARSALTRAPALPTSSSMKFLAQAATRIFLFGLALAGFAVLTCTVYSTYLCDPSSTSLLQTTMQKYCGSCIPSLKIPSTTSILTINEDLPALKQVLISINRELREFEHKMAAKFDARHSLLATSLAELRDQQRDLEIHIANVENRQQPASSPLSPLMQKINYFAPALGAVVDPYLTSPTKQKPFALPMRVFLRITGMTKYRSNPPITALEAWEDIGDCWCSSDSKNGRAQLGVALSQMIYPEEVVIEQYPSAGLPRPETAPKVVEIWAQFDHLTNSQRSDLKIHELQRSARLPATNMGLVGVVHYDIGPGSSNIQTFRLHVNQDALKYYTDKMVVTVASNHGASNTCLYRIRMHGQPLEDSKKSHADERAPAG